MKYVFGPVPSRRLGKSLGIDPVPLKTCNWNCVYCQLGRSKPLVNDRREYFPRADILSEVQKTLALHKTGEIDWITFVGSGETTLHTGLGWLIEQVKCLTTIPVAVITNGSLLYLPELRKELSAADAVLPSLDAGNAYLYRKLNRPHPQACLTHLIQGLIAFRSEYQGKLWVEVMLVKDMNDGVTALREIAQILEQVQPDEVHILQPERPPVETWVQPPDDEGLLRARTILGTIARVVHPASGTFDLGRTDSLIDAVLGVITRHPIKESELINALNSVSPGEVQTLLSELIISGKAQVIERYGIRFWGARPAIYPPNQ